MNEGAVAAIATADVSKYMYQIRKLKGVIATLTSERDSARGERDQFKAEAGELRTKTDSSALVKRNQELEGKLRVIEHRKVLDKAALDKGVKPEALDAFYKLSEYDAKGEPDADNIGAFVDSKIESLAFLTAPAVAETAPERLVKKGAASGKGDTKSLTPNGFQIPPKDDPRWNDAKWQWDNQEKLTAAYKAQIEQGIV